MLGIENEVVIPLFTNHRDICRFDGETKNYNTVSRAIRRIASQSPTVRKPLGRSSTNSSDKSESEIGRVVPPTS